MAKHDFGILEQFEENKWYQEYEPEKYNCISVDMDVMDEVFDAYREEIGAIKAFACVSTQPIQGLDEWSVNLIPPQSLEGFYNIIVRANKSLHSEELVSLIDKMQEAMKNKKYLIHFGI